MAYGKKITLFLMDGDTEGRWTCELSNWTGKAYKIPRTLVKECAARDELKQAGVYFLLGRNDVNPERPLAYIGEAESVWARLRQHLDGKDFWNEVVVFISKDNNLNKAHIKFLENSFYNLAKKANRYDITNDQEPTKSKISEPEQAELEEFIEKTRVIVKTLGYRLFEPLISQENASHFQNSFYLKTAKIHAEGMLTSEGFVVKKGAAVSAKTTQTDILHLRDKYISEKKVVNNIVQTDILFSSSSAAARFLVGYNISGPGNWKNDQGQSLKELEINDENNCSIKK